MISEKERKRERKREGPVSHSFVFCLRMRKGSVVAQEKKRTKGDSLFFYDEEMMMKA